MNSHQRRILRRKDKGNHYQFVKDWAELAAIPDSETHHLDISLENGNGWIKRKDGKDTIPAYLSTHTFYGSTHARATKVLRKHGFMVTLANWDAEELV